MFWLKKLISFWMMPVPLCLTLLAIGWPLTFFRSRRSLGRWLVGAATALLLLFSNKTFSCWLVRSLETNFPPIPEFTAQTPPPPELAACRVVVVLGGGHSDTALFPAVNRLSTSAQGRLMEAIRLLRVLPEARLLLTGPGERGRPSHADVLAQAAISLGVPADRILRAPNVRDTADEAVETARIAQGSRVALVTSAWHLRRAVALFRHAGVDTVPCPSDYAYRPSPDRSLLDYSWDVESLGRSTRACHEHLGYAWAKLRRQI